MKNDGKFVHMLTSKKIPRSKKAKPSEAVQEGRETVNIQSNETDRVSESDILPTGGSALSLPKK